MGSDPAVVGSDTGYGSEEPNLPLCTDQIDTEISGVLANQARLSRAHPMLD